MFENLEPIAVKLIQAILCAHPNVPIQFVLQQTASSHLRETFLDTVPSKPQARRYLSKERVSKAKQTDQKKVFFHR